MERAKMERVRPASAIPHVAGLPPESVPVIKAPVVELPEYSALTTTSIEMATKELELAIVSACARKISSVKSTARMKRANATDEQLEAFIDYELATLAFTSMTTKVSLPTSQFQNDLLASMAIKEIQIRFLTRCS
jgi:hypothetical protein